MSTGFCADTIDELEKNIAMYAIALRAIELDIAVKSALGTDLSPMLSRQAEVTEMLERSTDKWLSMVGTNAQKMFAGKP